MWHSYTALHNSHIPKEGGGHHLEHPTSSGHYRFPVPLPPTCLSRQFIFHLVIFQRQTEFNSLGNPLAKDTAYLVWIQASNNIQQ